MKCLGRTVKDDLSSYIEARKLLHFPDKSEIWDHLCAPLNSIFRPLNNLMSDEIEFIIGFTPSDAWNCVIWS